MFQSARIKLTLLYVLIAFMIASFFSFSAYHGFGAEFERGLQRQQLLFENKETHPQIHHPHKLDPKIIEEVRHRILMRLLLTDFIIILISAIAGYFLAGITLQPIKKMLDEQNRFITDASHELNTPLTSLRTTIEVNLRNNNMSLGNAQDVLKSNLEEVIGLQTLASELITLAQYKELGPTSKHTRYSLDLIIKAAITKLHSLAQSKHVDIVYETSPLYIVGDSKSLIELFVIILDKAIKYSTNQSTITISSTVIQSFVKIIIIDKGIGISKDDLPHIFNRFYRADKSRTKQDSYGYGLGLSIAKRIVQLHHGTITVTSILHKGTTLTILLPESVK